MREQGTLLVIPTYNEKENVVSLFEEISHLYPELDVLFVDDNSPDGTGKILEELSKTEPRLKVMHRSGKLGIGSAHLAGIQSAYKDNYQRVLTMDCDFTHSPSNLSELLRLSESFDIVVGSRYLKDKSLKGWNLLRKSLTKIGHALTLFFLKMPYDATGGLRIYNIDKIPQHAFALVGSQGYSFFFESLYILHLNGFTIGEIPIDLPPRTYGHSKMNLGEVRNSVKTLITTFLTTKLSRERYKILEPLPETFIDNAQIDPQGWDSYWARKKIGSMYDIAATFYRKFLIKKSLNFFIQREFKPGSKILHAGCGGGQVDVDIRHFVRITGLDISINAIQLYRQLNQSYCEVVHGNILNIPLPSESVDGIYNLGVMEHFNEEQIQTILSEFYRVLKPESKLVIFWPPEYGLTVVFLKVTNWFLKKMFRNQKNANFHPEEITRIRSKHHAEAIFKKANFSMDRYEFGRRDLFTYAIIIAHKPI